MVDTQNYFQTGTSRTLPCETFKQCYSHLNQRWRFPVISSLKRKQKTKLGNCFFPKRKFSQLVSTAPCWNSIFPAYCSESYFPEQASNWPPRPAAQDKTLKKPDACSFLCEDNFSQLRKWAEERASLLQLLFDYVMQLFIHIELNFLRFCHCWAVVKVLHVFEISHFSSCSCDLASSSFVLLLHTFLFALR